MVGAARRRHNLLVAFSLLVSAACSNDRGDVRADAVEDTTTTAVETTTTTVDTTTSTVETTTTEVPATTTTEVPATTTTVAEPVAAAPQVRLVYLGEADDGEPLDVWTADLDGGDRRVLIEDIATDRNPYVPPALSPDGTRLAYLNDVDARVHVIDLDRAGTDVPVSSMIAWGPWWLDDGTVVFQDREGTHHAVAPDGSGERGLPGAVVPAFDGRTVLWDGTYVVTDRDGTTTKVSQEEGQRLIGVLAPDGAHVAFRSTGSCRCPAGSVQIARPDGSEMRSLTPREPSYFGHVAPAWADAQTLYVELAEVAIERVDLEGQVEEVIDIRHGWWKLLGVRVTPAP